MPSKKQNGVGYKVGYKKPPQHSRFKKGKSGNPSGRPKGALNKVNDNSLYALLDQEVSGVVSIMNGDQKLTMTRASIVIKTLIQSAMKGNTRAIAMALEHMKIMDEKGLAEAARLARQQAADLEARVVSMTDEEFDEYARLIKRLNQLLEPSPPPAQQARLRGPNKPTDPEQ